MFQTAFALLEACFIRKDATIHVGTGRNYGRVYSLMGGVEPLPSDGSEFLGWSLRGEVQVDQYVILTRHYRWNDHPQQESYRFKVLKVVPADYLDSEGRKPSLVFSAKRVFF